MTVQRQILAAIFDMDGLLIDSEPLWDRAELEVMEGLGVDISRRDELPDLLGLRIDMVVDLWYAQQPWNGPGRDEVTARIISRTMSLVEAARPLLPGVREAVALCKAEGLKIGLASASPLSMLENVLTMFGLRGGKITLQQTASAGVSRLCGKAWGRSVNVRYARRLRQRHDRHQSRADALDCRPGTGGPARSALCFGER